ncbi:hypothetical protein Calab_0934 [Caldithrix abyssi DSM 13497]|uniref:Uncharacterized protein n=1 Tax=Caldithrix abyssi DSM 13497 TaxID=880073 RepID=H1XV62_CALAY|nr:hypothetical protein [Caldithrix abyssi]APF16766.1 hypothetical protein Cabys_15 [Caldithrix abyssi DSM 13497]EHO40568.1 hypothetical protein Calab_0934 [Caldithrix abyssi DSM 13497]
MSKHEAKGSIVLELIIVLLVAALVAVILIPGKIWKEQEQEAKTAHSNMTAIYEALKYYKTLTGKYTSDPAELLNTIRADSNLMRKQKVVNYTRELIRNFNGYLNSPYVRNLMRIRVNISQIIDDLESNRYHFRTVEEINNEANELKIQLGNYLNSPAMPDLVKVFSYLDSLNQIKQTLTDYTLQVNTMKIISAIDSLEKYLQNVDPIKAQEAWAPLSERIAIFDKKVKRSPINRVSSVADRVEDFRKRVDGSFEQISGLDIAAELQNIQQRNQALKDMYQKFLKDYNVTSQFALSKLSEADSLIVHLTEKNFYSPVNGQMYKILFDSDSQFVKIESPVLLDELKEKATPVAKEIEALPFMPIIEEYIKMVDSTLKKANEIRSKYRKNADMFIAYKELEDLKERFDNLTVITAANDLSQFVQIVPRCQSYSLLKENIEKTLNGVRVFNQAYSENVFGNLDSVNVKLLAKLDEFNEYLSKIKTRRRRATVPTLENERMALDSLLTAFKTVKDEQLIDKLNSLEKELEHLFVFAEEGKKIKVYGVFDKEIKNFGYIYKDVKSWEEEKKK